MADYLAGLAARALGAAPVVRPRPAAQFEPQPLEEAEVAAEAPILLRVEPKPVDATRPRRRPATEPPPLEQAAEESAPAAPPAAPQPVCARVEPRARARERRAPPAEQIVPEEATTPPAGADEPEPRAVTPSPRAVVRATTRRRVSEPPAPKDQTHHEAPPVLVTIGRIEVRAVTPAAPASPGRPSRRPPALSLDDYLEQRRGGRR